MKNTNKLNLKNKHFIPHWKSITAIIVTLTLLILGYKLFISDSKIGTYISIKLFHSKNVTIELSNDNIYDNGLDNIISDISKKITLPKELYVSGDFKILFNSDGAITSINGLLYGKNKNNSKDSFLISYDKNKSKDLNVYLNKKANDNYDKKYSFDPLITSLKAIPLRYSVGNCNETEFEILYSGEKEWDADTKGIIYINSQGETKELKNPSSKVTGYTVSVFVPNKEEKYTPLKYTLVDDIDNVDGEITTEIYRSDLLTLNKNKSKILSDDTIEFKLNNNITYNLKSEGWIAYENNPANEDTFMVLRYVLYKINEDTKKSTLINNNVFDANISEAQSIFFLDENIGFALSYCDDGSHKKDELYRTEDGGKTFEKVDLSKIKIELASKEVYSIKFMGIPYEENGELFMKLIYSNDQIYRGYVLCKSRDKGITWSVNKVIPEDTIQNKS